MVIVSPLRELQLALNINLITWNPATVLYRRDQQWNHPYLPRSQTLMGLFLIPHPHPPPKLMRFWLGSQRVVSPRASVSRLPSLALINAVQRHIKS